MPLFDSLAEFGHEQLLFCQDPAAGYRGVIAIHSTTLGPAVGGTRFWRYETEEDAITDALRLARGMTYKNAAADIPLGGGKSVILEPEPGADRREVLRAHGRFIERLGGTYITGEDVGTGPADMQVVREATLHVAGLPGLSGDPSPYTALGVFRAMEAAAQWRWGNGSLAGRTVAVQGCGHVGTALCRLLAAAGARLIVSDVDGAKAARLAADHDARVVPTSEILDQSADVFAPCALGGVLNERSIPRLRVEIVAGAANNQLLGPGDGRALTERGILYIPDYIANAGGVINGCREVVGWASERTLEKVRGIHDTVLRLLDTAAAEGITTDVAADRLAEERLRAARGGPELRIAPGGPGTGPPYGR